MTAVLAIYGAVLSSLVAAWSVYREITNRGRLRVIVTLADIGAAGVGRIATNRLWYKVINAGRQPIWLKQIGGGLRNGREFLLTVRVQFPIKLDSGERSTTTPPMRRNLTASRSRLLARGTLWGRYIRCPDVS